MPKIIGNFKIEVIYPFPVRISYAHSDYDWDGEIKIHPNDIDDFEYVLKCIKKELAELGE